MNKIVPELIGHFYHCEGVGKSSLSDILESRDARALRQRELLGAYPGKTLISFTVIPPGEVKRTGWSPVVAAEGLSALHERFTIIFEEKRDLPTGFEAFLVVDLPALEVKRICCDIEDTHPLGRLMDIDVITETRQDGALAEPSPRPMTRAEIGLPERRCLICERPARECIRARRHTADELLARYNEILKR